MGWSPAIETGLAVCFIDCDKRVWVLCQSVSPPAKCGCVGVLSIYGLCYEVIILPDEYSWRANTAGRGASVEQG